MRVAPAHVVAGRRARLTVTVTHRYGGRVHRVEGARVEHRHDGHALTGSDGAARVTVRRSKPGSLRVAATKERLLAGRASLVVRAR